jgi:hypothetical protein
MHAGFQELLSLRDGAPVGADVAQHVARCADCRRELDRLTMLKNELRELPALQPPLGSWSSIREELARSPIRPRHASRMAVSAAAALIVALAATLWLSTHRDRGGVVADSPAAKSASDRKDMIGPLVNRSQQLEGILQSLPPRPIVERAATSATIDELQARIQLLDLQLSAATNDPDRDRMQGLWNARVQLLSSLVSVRYAEAVRSGGVSVNSFAGGVI